MTPVDAAAGSFFYVLEDPLRILYVDDDPILREFAVVHLSTDQARVTVAADGAQGLEALRRDSFDLILLDLDMPNVDGFGVLEALRAEPGLSDAPVIVVTGREDVSAIDRAFTAGATSFVVKPLNWRLLSYQIRFVQRSHRTEQSLRGARERERGERRRVADLRRLAHDGAEMLALAMSSGPDLRRAAIRYASSLTDAVATAPSDAHRPE